MSRYIMIRRLRGPAFILLVGVNALLAQTHILGWDKSWPLYLILWGVLVLAERAALAAEESYPPPPYPGPNPGAYPASNPGQYAVNQTPGSPWTSAPFTATADPAAGQTGTAIVSTQTHDLVKAPNDFEGEQL
jgi:hypothetical protein